MFTKDYWNERALKYGHTGHAEPFYYCFDQEARKFAIREVIRETAFQQKNKALDFGCGSGDFIPLLLESFQSVSGFDISETVIEKAKPRFAGTTNVTLSHAFKTIEAKGPYDLALSVTVLQNLSKQELQTTLQLLYANLNNGAHLVCLDAFLSTEKKREQNMDKATTDEWLQCLTAEGFKLQASRAFYNPVMFPTRSWKLY